MPQTKYQPKQFTRSKVLTMSDSDYEQLVLLVLTVRDTIVELHQLGEPDEEDMETLTRIYNALTDNDKYNMLKPYLDPKESKQ